MYIISEQSTVRVRTVDDFQVNSRYLNLGEREALQYMGVCHSHVRDLQASTLRRIACSAFFH